MRLVRERRGRPVVADADTEGAGEAMAVAADTVAAAATVASEGVTNYLRKTPPRRAFFVQIGSGIWAGLDSNQRRRKASRFTVCPVWPLRNLPVRASVDIGSRPTRRK